MILDLWKQADGNAEAQLDHAKNVQRKVRSIVILIFAVLFCNSIDSAGAAIKIRKNWNTARQRRKKRSKMHPEMQASILLQCCSRCKACCLPSSSNST